jgi:acyl-CoA thioester hydrolase
MQIEPQWIDYNGHLNMAYYNVMFDRAIDQMWLNLGDPVQISVFLIAADEKRLHTFEELRHATDGWLSATSENMTIHMDMTARKTAPFPPDIRARIQEVADAHAAIPRPEGLGRNVAMPAGK